MTHAPNVNVFVREMVTNIGWRVAETTTSMDAALNIIRTGKASLIILDDNIAEPVSFLMRRLIGDPLGVLTPTIALVLEQNRREAEALSRMGKPEVIPHPLSVGAFAPRLRGLLKRWEVPFMESCRQAAGLVILGKVETGLRMLTQLNNSDPPSSLPTQALAYFYRQLKEHRTAEKILLAALQKSPTDLGCIFSLSDLYLHSAMPGYALKLLSGAATAFSTSLTLLPDLVEACVMLGRLDEAIVYLYRMHDADFLGSFTQNYLVRLLLAEGRDQEVGRLAARRRELTLRTMKTWSDFETPAATNAAAS